MIEIDITFECNLKCKGCSLYGYAPSSENMTIDDIKCFINEEVNFWVKMETMYFRWWYCIKIFCVLSILQREYADNFYP